jgi:uncharacterized protein
LEVKQQIRPAIPILEKSSPSVYSHNLVLPLLLGKVLMFSREKFRRFLRRSMDSSTLVMMGTALVLLVLVYYKSPESANKGLNATVMLVLEITPRMIAAFTIAGLIQVIVPQDVIVRWMGQGSGMKGILIGMTLGTVTPGGPMTHFPIIASLFKVGVGIGPLVAYLTAWSLIGLQRIIMWELPFLGPHVVAIRVAVSFLFPFLAGWLSELLWTKLHL